jgi:hypothetical protein
MSRLTEQRIADLILSADWLIAAGASPNDAATALNVPAATMREWRERIAFAERRKISRERERARVLTNPPVTSR